FLQEAVKYAVAIAHEIQTLQWSVVRQEVAKVLEIFTSKKRSGCYKTDNSAGLAQMNGEVSEKPIKVCVAKKRFLKAGSLPGSKRHFSVRRITNYKIKRAQLVRRNFQSVARGDQIIEWAFGQ